MNRRRRHRPMGSNRPEAPAAYVIAAVSVLSIAVHIFSIYVSFRSGGNTENWLGGLGVLFIMTGLLCLIAGYRIFKNTDYTLRSRLVALLTSIVALVLWLQMYILGILYG